MKRLVLALCALVSASPTLAATISVSSPSDSQWTAKSYGYPVALRNAKAGDVIELGSGAYPLLNLSAGWIANGLTFKPAAGAKVSIAGVNLTGDGKAVNNWTLSGPMKITAPVSLASTVGVTLDGLEIAPTAIPADLFNMPGSGVSYRNVTDLTLRNVNVHHWGGALSGMSANGLTITDSTFSDASSDLLHLGGNLQRALIARNLLTRVYATDLTHQDALQTFAPVSPMQDVTIADNRILRGEGGSPVQGMLLQASATSPIKNLKITGNLVMEGNWWGIGVVYGEGVEIRGNYYGGFTDATNGGQMMTPWLKVMNSKAVTIADNTGTGTPLITPENVDVKVSGHKVIGIAKPGDMSAAEAWAATKSGAAEARPEPPAVNPLQAVVDNLTAIVADLTTQTADLKARLSAALAKIDAGRNALN